MRAGDCGGGLSYPLHKRGDAIERQLKLRQVDSKRQHGDVDDANGGKQQDLVDETLPVISADEADAESAVIETVAKPGIANTGSEKAEENIETSETEGAPEI